MVAVRAQNRSSCARAQRTGPRSPSSCQPIRRPMARFLGKRGAEVTEAGDGVAALERIRGGFEPQVILADLRMPRMDGAEFYERLLEEQPRLAERVLFLSGDITHLAGRGLADVPRDRVLVKPVELAELERRIGDFLREMLPKC